MTRDTSIEAYNTIKDNKSLKGLKWAVYHWLYSNGPASAMDITTALADGKDHGSYSTRLSELRDAGAIKEVGKEQSKHSIHTVIMWDVTNKLPVKVPKKLTKIKALLWNISQIAKQMKEQGPLFHEEAILALEELQNDDEPF